MSHQTEWEKEIETLKSVIEGHKKLAPHFVENGREEERKRILEILSKIPYGTNGDGWKWIMIKDLNEALLAINNKNV